PPECAPGWRACRGARGRSTGTAACGCRTAGSPPRSRCSTSGTAPGRRPGPRGRAGRSCGLLPGVVGGGDGGDVGDGDVAVVDREDDGVGAVAGIEQPVRLPEVPVDGVAVDAEPAAYLLAGVARGGEEQHLSLPDGQASHLGLFCGPGFLMRPSGVRWPSAVASMRTARAMTARLRSPR